MRWLMDTPGVGCVLFGAKNSQQVKENATTASGWRLSPEDYQYLKYYPTSDKPRFSQGQYAA